MGLMLGLQLLLKCGNRCPQIADLLVLGLDIHGFAVGYGGVAIFFGGGQPPSSPISNDVGTGGLKRVKPILTNLGPNTRFALVGSKLN